MRRRFRSCPIGRISCRAARRWSTYRCLRAPILARSRSLSAGRTRRRRSHSGPTADTRASSPDWRTARTRRRGAVRTGDAGLGDRLMIGREDAGIVGPMSVAQRLADAGVDDGEVVHALVRGLAVILAFDAVHPELT